MMLGQELIHRGLINEEKLEISLRVQGITGERLGEVLVRLGFITNDQLRDVLLDIKSEALDSDHSHTEFKLPPDFLKKTRTIIQGDPGNRLYISTLHSNPDEVIKTLEQYTGRIVELRPAKVKTILEKLYRHDEGIPDDPMDLVDDDDVAKILSAIITLAIRERASDIHIIPDDRSLYVNIVIDGIPYNHAVYPLSKADMIIAAIKVRAGMNVSETRIPQDGGYSFIYKNKSIDLRVSTLRIDGGEKVTIRILNKEDVMKNIHELGITCVNEYLEAANQSTGIVLVCGPTGAGKSTTLYSTIMSYDRIHETINTIEDPIEYRLPGIQQSQVNPKLDPPFTYASFTRTVLRHAPRKIIIGEIRDKETAQNAFTLAETGHFILSTLHTSDIPTTIKRLKGLGVDRTLLPLLLRGILVQRLVRKICTKCGGAGCGSCRDGYSGRSLLTEFARFRKPSDIDATLGEKLPYHTFATDAAIKVKAGITDCSEISRVSEGHIMLCNGGSCISGLRHRCAARSSEGVPL